MEHIPRILTFITALGCGLMAGIFFVFSVAIMRALGRLSKAEGIRAMQSINIAIVNPIFLGVFLGTGIGSGAIIVLGLLRFGQPGWGYLIAGAAVYLIGGILVTIIFNVPLNNSLAAVGAETPEAENVWQNYLRNWTYWNNVRTLASLFSTALFILGIAS